jgi:hypothetical protein
LLYDSEDISSFANADIIPYKLREQTVYFESEAFRHMGALPHARNIGFITPSFYRKQTRTLDEMFATVPENLTTTYYLVPAEDRRLAFLSKFHGPAFMKIWTWLISALGYEKYKEHDFKGFSANMWIAPRPFVVKYVHVMKRAIYLCDNAPKEIHALLYSDPHYNGSIKDKCMEKFGIPHYPFHPFIMENIICFTTYLNDNGLF